MVAHSAEYSSLFLVWVFFCLVCCICTGQVTSFPLLIAHFFFFFWWGGGGGGELDRHASCVIYELAVLYRS